MTIEHDYVRTFGDDPRREQRGRVLAGILNLEQIPGFADAWVEKGQNPDKPDGVGPIWIVFYLEIGVGPEGRAPHALGIFYARSHPMYRGETDDAVAHGYTKFRYAVPDGLSPRIVASLAARAVDPVDTAARWTKALS